MLLQGKIALVTGASRGIGKAIAMDLAQHGAIVLGTATTFDAEEKITAMLKGINAKGQGLTLNVNDTPSIDKALAIVQAKYGMPDILINNAGITRDNLLLRMKEQEWDEVLNTNLTGIFRLTKVCLRNMLKSHWGRIINISSVVGITGNPGQANYAAAKAGLIGFTKTLAQEVASRNITVNAVAPGFIETDMTKAITTTQREEILSKIPLARLGTSQEVAYAVRFLVSPLAEYITGQTIHVNGGLYLG